MDKNNVRRLAVRASGSGLFGRGGGATPRPRRLGTRQRGQAGAWAEPLEGRRLLSSEALEGGDATWFIVNNTATDNGRPAGGGAVVEGNGVNGVSVEDGVLGEQGNAFDYGSMVWVDGKQLSGVLKRTAEGNTVNVDAPSIAGLNIRMQYRAIPESAVLRNIVTLRNPTAGFVTVSVDLATNFGSDNETSVVATSSGDRVFADPADIDRWIVTDDDPLRFDPANVTVLAGPGGTQATTVSDTVFDKGGTQGVLASFEVTVPPGKARSLMFFHELSDTAANAATAAAGFNVNPSFGSELIKDLSFAELVQVVNWKFNSPPQANASGPYEVSEGGVVTLNAEKSSTDPDTDVGDVLTYAWDLDGDGKYDDATGAKPTFSAAGLDGSAVSTRTVAVLVTDAAGETDCDTAVLNVTNADPTAGDDAVVTSEDTLVTVDVLGNDADAAGNLDRLTVTSSTNGANGTVTVSDDGMLTYTPAANFHGTDTFAYTIGDGDGGSATATVTVTVNPVNDAPDADAGADLAGDEGSRVTFAGAGSDADGDGDDPLQYAWDFGDGQTGTGPTPEHTYADNGTYTATLTVSDGQGASDSDAVVVTVANVAPAVSVGGDAVLNEGGTFTRAGSFADPGSDMWAATVDYGDGAGPQPLATNADKTFTLNHVYPNSGSYLVTVAVDDGDGGHHAATLRVRVDNVAPTATVSNSGPVVEGTPVTISVADPADPSPADRAAGFKYSYDFDGNGTFEVADSSRASVEHAYADAGTFNARVRIADRDGGFTDYTTAVVVSEATSAAAPVVGAISAPADPTPVGTVVNASASFTDADASDTHTAVWDWGDGTTSAGTVTEAGGTGSVRGGHAYAEAGVYTVTLTVTDNDGAFARQAFHYVVVYDASAGFVTGGGWINSPAGAYAADPSAAGKATFGFVARHQKGAAVPTGNTEFQLKAGNLNFKSTGYDWLVISGGGKAKYKGTGTINGRGSYGFMLTVVDGSNSGPDKFRIKIWDKSTNAVVYDNQMGAGDDEENAGTALGGGSIVIHTK